MKPLWSDQDVPEPSRAPFGWDEPIIAKDRRLGQVIMDSLDRDCVGKRIGIVPEGILHRCSQTTTMRNYQVSCCRIAGHFGLHWPSNLPDLIRIEGQDA